VNISEHLSPLDAMFLELEESDDSALMHIGGVMVFEPLAGGLAPSLDEVRRNLDARLSALPRFRQRLSSTRTGGLYWPSWEPVERFEVADHVRRAILPSPADDNELFEWIGDFYSHRLDRSRPLWEMVLLEGLRNRRWALATKIHHCLVDGVGGVDVGQVLLDASPDAPAAGAWSAPPTQLAEPEHGSPWWSPVGELLRGARSGLGVATHPDRLRELFDSARAVTGVLVHDELVAAPKSSLNVTIGATRRFEAIRFELDDLKAIKNTFGGTVNDVALTLAAGGLRRLLLHRGDALPQQGLRAQVPVNIRSGDDRPGMGNHLTSLFVHLPVAEPDPLARYRRVLKETRSLKGGDQARGARTLIELTGLAPPALHTHLSRTLFDTRLFNLTITNVPGAPEELYAFGAPMRELIPLVPLFARHSIGIAIFSYAGRVVIGVNADRDTVGDLRVLTAGMERSFAELEECSGVPVDVTGLSSAPPATSARVRAGGSGGHTHPPPPPAAPL
jgi:diacylglycerol O-acyltransferase